MTGSGTATFSGTASPQPQLQLVIDFTSIVAYNIDRITLALTGFIGGGATGEDLKIGIPVLTAGKYLRPAELGLIASLGIGEVRVRRMLETLPGAIVIAWIAGPSSS